jgi:cell wall-associated NlpC family hydrolase
MTFDITPYRFLEWREGEFCCADYVRLVYRDYLGVELEPMPYAGGPHAAASALARTRNRRLFRVLAEPTPLCVVEMQQYRSPDHVGIYVLVDGKPMVTHCERGSGVCLSTLGEIAEIYQITGYYEYVGEQNAASEF